MLHRLSILLALGTAFVSRPASAHWCHDLWASSYNIVVKPVQDSVTVSAGGQATLELYVQNNMGYPLKNFSLVAELNNVTVSLAHATPKKAGFLLPGESLKYTATISGVSGTVAVEDLTFDVGFGEGGQDSAYGTGNGGGEVMIRRKDVLVPAAPFSFSWSKTQEPNAQAINLATSVQADYGLTGGIGELMNEFCIGRASWSSGSASVNTTNCSGTATNCPSAQVTRSHTKYDYEHLWAAGELGARRTALGSYADPLRARLQCATKDSLSAFHFFPFAILGYLGESASARTFLTTAIASGSADDQAAAKAALLLFRDSTDRTNYHADVVASLSSSNAYVQMLAATTLGIIDADDAVVQSKLIANSNWTEPDTDDNGLAMYTSHLLELVAWDRRGWAANALDTGTVSFYSTTTTPDTTPPLAPATVSCTALPDGGVSLSWSSVTLSEDGGIESMKGYRAYHGTTPRPAGAKRPTDFSYDSRYPTSGELAATSTTFAGLSPTQPSYFAVVAVDTSANVSAFSPERSCTPTFRPVAVLSCAPDAGFAPLDVTCTSAASTDPNGVADIVSRAWTLDGQAQVSGMTFSASFPTVSTHTIQLTVTDDAGLRSTASTLIRVLNPDGGNNPPDAVASATPLSGQPPLHVTFSSNGSSDPDIGQTLTYSWDFKNGATSTQPNPSSTFNDAGVYNVTLTVTDNGNPPAQGTEVVQITVLGNSPPDLSLATASPGAGDAPLVVTFDATNVTDVEGNQLSFSWDFGDGSATASTAQAAHTYSAPGTYTAVLSVNDDGKPALAAPATKRFTMTVHTAGVPNRSPDCSGATVTPLSGNAPLKIKLDASGCSDPDGDVLTLTWHVPRSITSEDTYSEPVTETTLTQSGSVSIRLHAKDSAADSLEIDRIFVISVKGSSSEPVLGGLGCTTSGMGSFGYLVLLLPMLRLGRGRRND